MFRVYMTRRRNDYGVEPTSISLIYNDPTSLLGKGCLGVWEKFYFTLPSDPDYMEECDDFKGNRAGSAWW